MADEDLDLGGEGGGEPTPPSAPADPFADTPADGGLGGEEEPTAPEVSEPEPGEGLGGDGGTLDDLGGEEELEEPAPGEEEPSSPAEDPPAEPEDDEPEAPPEPPAEPKAKAKGKGKKGTSERTYIVLQKFVPDEGEPYFRVAIPEGIKAGNGEQALRKAYAALVAEDSGDAITLVVIPEHYFNEKTVQAKVRHERAVEIS